ncbi:phosphate ABC transporter substrate-binding protein, PhoT family [Desulfonispora thiosulfatigenes DSM 11270]|uniref:Phosphate-binding protein n=1 Tax=Desulfonispora thiosulfatigenes DSM 11270 TaxID=656914 RepID=A0A1W1VFN0_DESTI|nr:phosphate ABC transporter substrate-binding protein [Desulfonispora thiosulfatigenes]SMB92197.1 phosphate ABC transporter substrate-binding protein, PhoT family [Desulfonispora thiosulfatigenes DSM 11270]
MFKKLSLLLVLILSLSVFLAGCGEKEEMADDKQEGLSGRLKLAGSTSVQPLAEELAMRFMELNPNVKIEIAGGGSGAGIESVAGNGVADIGMASRELKEEEKTNNQDIRAIVIAKDGLAVIVHPDNEVSELSTKQVKDIFTGEITNWKDVGGKDAGITVINREEGSGTRGAFQELVLGKEGNYTTKAAIQNSTGAVKEAVKADPNSIGYISMGSLSEDVVGVVIDGANPTTEAVKDGKYPISRPFNFIIKVEAQGLTKAFIDWVLENEGQSMVSEQGFISL